jgi:osmoprotectant transport system substrate-binding protein
VTIGAQDFGESKILAEIYKQGLAAEGFDTSVRELGGYRDLEVPAFEEGTINFAPEYAASMLEFLNNKAGEASGDVSATVDKLDTRLEDKDLAALEVSEAVDSNGFAVTQATADKHGLKSISDLAGKDLSLGGPADCPKNPYCIPGLQKTYDVDLSGKFKSLDAAAPRYAALNAGEIDVAVVFTTDGAIAASKLVLLKDDKQMFAADNIIPIVSSQLSGNSSLTDATNAITAKLTTEKLTAMNKRFDIDKEDAAAIAKDFLTDNDLI